METIDMKKLETAIVYLQRIADGNNPINNLPADEDSVLNNPNVIRCMYFVKEILQEVKKNGGCIGKKKTKNSGKLSFPIEATKMFSFRAEKPISKFTEQINEVIDAKMYKKVSYKSISDWLKKNDFLKDEYDQVQNKTVTTATEKGVQIGIRSIKRARDDGREYTVNMYGKQAQEYIVQNLDNILNGK